MLGGHHVPAAARARPVRRAARPGRPPGEKKPELMADGPNQVWSWHITKLKGPARGVCCLLYVIIDIFSRKVIWWDIWPTETGALAKEFIERAIEENGGIRPGAVHADRGTSMTSNTVAGLLATLGIGQSHSRPHVSNDNPYSEGQFKTLKYCRRFPGGSDPSKTPVSSARSSSSTTITNTAIPGSRCTPPHPSTTELRSRSTHNASRPRRAGWAGRLAGQRRRLLLVRADRGTGRGDLRPALRGQCPAAYFLVAALAPKMAARGSGGIISIGSMAGRIGLAGGAAYSATKATLAAMTRSWAAEFSPSGVRVNAIAAGPVLRAELGDQAVPVILLHDVRTRTPRSC